MAKRGRDEADGRGGASAAGGAPGGRPPGAAGLAAARAAAASAETRRAEAALARVAEAASGRVASALAAVGVEAEAAAFGVVPRMTRPLAPLPEARRAGFAARLDAMLDALFAAPAGGDGAGPEPDAETLRRHAAHEPALGAAACGACRGACCTLGASTDAFLTPDELRRARAALGEAGRAALRDAYLSRLPEVSVEGSCVFHGAVGCTLPREIRAGICNGFVCLKRRRVERAGKGRHATAILAADGKGPARVAVSRESEAGPARSGRAADPAALAPRLRAAAAAAAAPDPDVAAARRGPRCRFCDAPIGPHARASGAVCGAEACRRARIGETAAALSARRAAQAARRR